MTGREAHPSRQLIIDNEKEQDALEAGNSIGELSKLWPTHSFKIIIRPDSSVLPLPDETSNAIKQDHSYSSAWFSHNSTTDTRTFHAQDEWVNNRMPLISIHDHSYSQDMTHFVHRSKDSVS